MERLPADSLSIEDRVRTELRLLRKQVSGVQGSIVATSDGLLVADDIPALEPTKIAALVATTIGLARQTTQATGRGEFREAVARGSSGYLAVYAAGSSAVVAVIGTNELNIGMLHYQARDVIKRLAAYSSEFEQFQSGRRTSLPRSVPARRSDSHAPSGHGHSKATARPGTGRSPRQPVLAAAMEAHTDANGLGFDDGWGDVASQYPTDEDPVATPKGRGHLQPVFVRDHDLVDHRRIIDPLISLAVLGCHRDAEPGGLPGLRFLILRQADELTGSSDYPCHRFLGFCIVNSSA